MTNLKNTKRALFASLISLLLCFTMLIGTTYAWFTDSVTSSNNIIRSGTLDVVLEHKSNWSDDWAEVDENTKIFSDNALYEPGYTEVVYLRISNAGSLALKYLLHLNIANEEGSINVYGEEFRLSDYLQVGAYVQDEYRSGFNYADALMPSMFGTREAALRNVDLKTLSESNSIIRENAPVLPGDETAQIVALVLTMPETVGNEANTRLGEVAPYIELGISLYATQYTHEYDSFDNQYDANTEQPNIIDIYNEDDLHKAFEKGGIGRIKDMHLTEVQEELDEGKSLALNTNNSTISGTENDYVITNRGDLEITGDGTIVNNMKGSIANYGNLFINNLNIEVTGNKYGFHCFSGTVEINDLVLTAQRGGLNIKNGSKATINSANIKFSSYKEGSKVSNGYVVFATDVGTEVIINGGDFRYVGTNNKQRILCAQDGAKIIVNGGTFGKGSSQITDWIWEYDSNKSDDVPAGDVVIRGGIFQFDPTEFVDIGYKAVKGADGWWTVSAINN